MKFIGLIATVILSVVLTGLVTSVLWGWFVVPLGVAAITVPHAIGIGMLVTFLTTNVSEERKTRDFGEALFIRLTMCAAAIGVGWLLHGLM